MVQRHSKNAGTMGSEALTYHERKAMGHGTMKQRLGKDSIGNYDDCALTLQACSDPVMTPEGILFSKEAILENLLQQKKAIKRKMAEWEAQQAEEAHEAAEKQNVAQVARLVAFDRQNHMGISEHTAVAIQTAIEEGAEAERAPGAAKSVVMIKDNEDRMKQLKAFWMPSQQPTAKAEHPKPDTDTYCPASGKKLRMKDLSAVKFTRVREIDSATGGEAAGKHRDPMTGDTFTNASKLVVLKATGDVVMKETYEKLIKPDGTMNGVRIKEKEVVELKTGGTGFSARDGDRVSAEKRFQLGAGSGRQDLRGQRNNGASLGGLVIWN